MLTGDGGGIVALGIKRDVWTKVDYNMYCDVLVVAAQTKQCPCLFVLG